MDIDTLKKEVQDFFQEGTVTIVGSGLSLAEGIPGMQKLANELQKKIPKLLNEDEDKAIWSQIANDLNNRVGLEEALHNTKPSVYVEECIRRTTARYIANADRKVFEDILQNKKILRFAEYLNHFNIKEQGLTVITTNYDRLIEYACEVNEIQVDTLFSGKYIAKFRPDQSKFSFCTGIHRQNNRCVVQFAPRVIVLKPHGCLSWHMFNGIPCSIPSNSIEDSLIITPGLNKYREGYSAPFDTHRSKANQEIDKAQRYIIIGYGFGDDHLETHLMQQLHNGKPALILTHSLSAKTEKIIAECRNITAICHCGKEDTKVVTANENIVFHKLNIWDLHELIKEVF